MTRQDAVKWLQSEVGQHLDYDGKYGQQCTDFFRFYEAYLTGKNSYSITPGVIGAKDIWSVSNPGFTKVKNDTSKANQLPQPGDILIYNSTWGKGLGHVEVVISATSSKLYVIGENENNNSTEGVIKVTRTWSSVVKGLYGWLSYNNFTKEAPSAPKPTPKPAPKPAPAPPTKAPAPAPKPPVKEPEPPVVAPEPESPVTPPVVPPVDKTPSTPVKTAPKAQKMNFVNLLLTALLDILKAIFKRS